MVKSEETVVGWDIGQWLKEIGQDEGGPSEQDAPHTWSDFHVDDELDEQPSLPDKRGYRDAVFNSVAYRWLMAALAKTLLLAPVQGDDVCAHIQSQVSASLVHSRSISSRRASERHTMLFVAQWNPTDFLREQFTDNSDIGRLLGETLTLTGSATDAQALPCAEYMLQNWPMTGPTLLSLLKTALVSGNDVSGIVLAGTTQGFCTIADHLQESCRIRLLLNATSGSHI